MPIVASAAVGTGLGNYDITYVDGTLTVDAKALTITANNQTKTYGDTVTFAGTRFTTVGPGQRRHGRQRDADQRGRGGHGDRRRQPVRIVASTASARAWQLRHHLRRRHADGRRKALTITANDQSKTYGDAVTFAGTEVHARSGWPTATRSTSVTLTSAGARPRPASRQARTRSPRAPPSARASATTTSATSTAR